MDAITITNFTEEYAKGVKAVNDLSFCVKAGEIFGFIGKNGAGKSTTIKALTGQLPITGGSICVFGHDVAKEPLLAKREIGFCPDNHAVYENMTGRQYVNFIADVFGVGEERNRRIEVLGEKFGIGYALDRFTGTYSHGMRQKICLVASLVHDPALWVLDEPLTGLDISMVQEVRKMMLSRKAHGRTVFFSSHNLDVVQRICDRAALIDRGELLEVVDLEEFRKRGRSLEEHFFRVTEAHGKA